MAHLDVIVSEEMEETLLTVVDYGDHASTSEVVCEALDEWARRRDLKVLAKEALIAAVRIGYESGPSLRPEAVFGGLEELAKTSDCSDWGPTRLRFSPAAIADLLAVKLHVTGNNSDYAEFLTELENLTRKIADQPFNFDVHNDICLYLNEANYRGYVIFFSVLFTKEVRIQRIIRGGRDFIQTLRL